ncbi:hypothetical protein KR038_008131, partial [Drosophila bunnanda]
RNEKFYTCCDEPYLDITFNITMRRKTLFYTVNIIIPCMGISFLTVLTFYLPSDSGEKVCNSCYDDHNSNIIFFLLKVTLSISILISLHVFFLLVVEIIPPTSLVVPLLGKYLIFAMILVSISICVTVVVLNVHFRSPQTHRMAPWVKRVFIDFLPSFLFIKRPTYNFETSKLLLKDSHACFYPYYSSTNIDRIVSSGYRYSQSKEELTQRKVKEDWKYVAMVLDRLFLWIFTLAVLVGTAAIILQAPTLYDDRIPIIEQKDLDFSGTSAGRCKPPQ